MSRVKVILDIPTERLKVHPQRIQMMIDELDRNGFVDTSMKTEREILDDALTILKVAVECTKEYMK